MHALIAVPTEMSIIIKEHFNRWYSLKMYYTAVTLIDIPISVKIPHLIFLIKFNRMSFQVLCCFLFSVIIYLMSDQPPEWGRFTMFSVISLLVIFVAQGIGLMIGAWFDVVVSFLIYSLSLAMTFLVLFFFIIRMELSLVQHFRWVFYCLIVKSTTKTFYFFH